MGYHGVTSSAAHFQRNMAFPGAILSAGSSFWTSQRVSNGRCVEGGHKQEALSWPLSEVRGWGSLLQGRFLTVMTFQDSQTWTLLSFLALAA